MADAIFSVTLSTPWTQEVQVQFATSNGSATAGADYTATTGTVTFAANTNTPQLITVPILQDTLSEGNETFTVTLSNPTGSATFADNSGLGTITDDDLTADHDQQPLGHRRQHRHRARCVHRDPVD